MVQGENRSRSGLAVLCLSGALLLGCATASRDIASSYVSPMTYRSYDCDQLVAEMQRVQSRVHQLGARLDQAASNDKTLVGVGMLLFWPALFALGGTKEQEAEFARLKGEYEALQQALIEKKCASTAKPEALVAQGPAVPASAAASSATQ